MMVVAVKEQNKRKSIMFSLGRSVGRSASRFVGKQREENYLRRVHGSPLDHLRLAEQ